MTLHRAGIYNLSRLVPVPSEARLPLMPRWAHPPFTLLTLLPAVLLCLAAGAHARQGSVATDTAALQALYNSTDGANWTDNTNWTSDMALSTWHGVTTNGDGRVTRLELQENGLNGTLPTELENLTHLESLLLDRNYALMGPLPDGLRELLALATVDLTDTELCAPEDAAFQDWTATISSFSGLTRAPTEESVIDVAVFYTPQAREAQDGHDQIKAKIDLMVAETNRAYTDSGVDQRINPVVVEEVAYTETSLLTDIVRLKGPSDGHMDEVHAIRDRVWADIVMLIRARGGGQAVAMLTESTSHARNAFGLSGAHTGVFAHELGHIMGLKHDRYEECDASRCNSALSADAYGYVNQRAFDENAPASSRWRTIMAYNSQCDRDGFNCQWLLRFSNPNQLYPDAAGDPLGVALTSDDEDSIAVDGPANAVRVLNETRDTVADFRQGRAVKVFFDAGPYSVTEGGTVTVTVRLDAAPGRTLNIPIPLTANSLDGAWAGDYAMPSSIILGSNQTEQTFSLTAVNDSVQEAEETVTLGFGEPLPAGVTVGSQATATVTLTENDTVPGVPSVAEIAITSEPGPAYAAGEEVEVTVIFTRPVTVTGTPGLGLTIGTTTRPMVYQGARSASEVLVFAYTVADGESDTDGVSIPENSLEGTIRDSANQDAAMLTHAAVDADHTVDGVAPELDTAAADGAVVTLTFDEVLDETSIPAEDAFTVTAAGATLSVDSVEVSEMVVTLTLASAVTDGQEVTVTYTVPGTNPIRDAVGNDARPLANRAVENNTRDTTAPVITTPSPILVPENETAVATLTATDDTPSDQLTWTIPSGTNGGADADRFTLSTAGALAFAAAKDYEIPDDADGDRTYEVTVQVSDGTNPVTAVLSVTVENVIELATEMTGPATVEYAENRATRVATYIASSEADRAGIAWSLGGDDKEHFSVDNPAGVLRFHIDPVDPSPFPRPPDFEAPVDDDRDNDYEVFVLARAGSAFTVRSVLVTVTNENEAGTLSLDSPRPRFGEALTASVSDPDGAVSAITWQWERSTGPGAWEVIGGATAAGYRPTAADTNAFLRVTATYDDEHGSGHRVRQAASNVVTGPLLTALQVATDAATANLSRAMNPAFGGETLHYAIGCNDSDTMQVTLRAPSDVRVAVDGRVPGGSSTGEMTATVEVTRKSDVPISVTDRNGAHTVYRVHCLDARLYQIEAGRYAGAEDVFEGLLLFGHEGHMVMMDSNGVPRFRETHADARSRTWFFRVGTDEIYRYAYATSIANRVNVLDQHLEVIDEQVSTVFPLRNMDPHDFVILPNGNYLLMSYERQGRNLSHLTFTDAEGTPYHIHSLYDSAIQIITPDEREALFTWNSWGKMPLGDCVQHRFARSTFAGYAHLNSLQLVGDHTIVGSFRGCSKVLGIDVATGSVKWRVGRTNLSDEEWASRDIGPAPIMVVNDPEGEFCGQHSATILPNGHLLLFDNGAACLIDPWKDHQPVGTHGEYSRAVEYALDLAVGEAVFVRDHSLHGNKEAFGYSGGQVVPMDNGDWLISWGRNLRGQPPLEEAVTQVDPATGQQKFFIRFTEENTEERPSLTASRVPADALADTPGLLSAEISENPANSAFHLGPSDAPKVVVAFSRPLVDFAADTTSVRVSGATIAGISPHIAPGDPANAWLFTLTPTGVGPIAFALVAGQSCASGGICTADGTVLTEVGASHVIPPPAHVKSIESDATHPTKDPFTVTITFSKPVTGLTGSEIEVTNGAGSTFSGSGATYRLRVTPDTDIDGDVTVTVPAGVAEDSSMNGNQAGSATFAVDTLAPALAAANGATVNGATLTLTFDEALRAMNTAPSAFTVTGATTRSVSGVSVAGSTVQLILSVPVLHGETGIEVDYDPPTREPIADAVGNKAASVTDRPATNNTPATTLSTAVRLTMDEARVAEAGPAKTVTVTGMLDRAARPGATTVAIEVGAGTDAATEGSDFAPVGALTLTIPAYATSGTVSFTLTPMNDRTAEGTETISVRGNVAELTVTPAELAIVDDDTASTRLDLSLNPSTVSEAAVPTEVVVTGSLDAGARTSDSVVTVTVGAFTDTATEGLDYANVSTLRITVPANETTGRTMFTLSPENDAVAEGAETITVTGRAGGLTVEPAVLTLSDNDTASRVVTLSVDPESVAEDTPEDVTVTASLNAGARAENMQVRLTVGAAGDTAVPGTDYERVPERTLTVLPGETVGTATFRLEPLDNDSTDGARTLSVTGSTPVAELRIEPASGAKIALADDDSPAVLLMPQALTVVEAGSASYAVTLQTRPTADVTVTITGVSGDLSLDKTSLVFTGADWSDPRDVRVTAADDADSVRDPDVTLTHRASGAAEYRGLRADLVVSIQENDPGLVFSECALRVPEGQTATYTVALATAPTAAVTVRVTGVSGDLSLDRTRLDFTGGDWDSAKTVTVGAAEDDDTSTDPAVTLTHRASDGGYDGIVGEVRVTVTENDGGGGTGGGSGGGGGANRPPVVEREIDDRTLDVGEVLELDIRLNFYDRDQRALDYSVESADPSVATVAVDRNGVLTIRGVSRGVTAITVTVADRRDERASDTFLVAVKGPALVALLPRASDPVREGFVRVINHAAEAGEVTIEAVDDTGMRLGPVTLLVDAGATAHFNSGDLEDGNADKGLPTGVGSGEGDWRLVLDSDLDFEALSYIRTADGFLTAMHDTVPVRDGAYEVAIFNPGSNSNQVSRLRLVNPGAEDAQVTITGIDDAGASPGAPVTVTVPAGASRSIEAAGLEAGADGFAGALGDGAGKWRLRVESDQPIVVMSLLSSPTGHLTNLSSAPDRRGN